MSSLLREGRILLDTYSSVVGVRFLSNKSAFITKIHRKDYLRLYPTLVVQPNGSTFTIRHHEPRRIIKLPINLSELSEEERAEVLQRRKPKKKVVYEDEIEDTFDSKKYLKYFKTRN